MENFRSKSPPTEKVDDYPYLQEIFLNEEEEAILSEALYNFKSYLSQTENLPSVMVFPETSARPLVWAIKPIVKEIYSQRNGDLPSFNFIKVYPEEILSSESNKVIKFKPFLQRLEARNKEKLQLAKERAKEIINLNNINNLSEVLIIDDFATKERRTVNTLRKCFKKAFQEIFLQNEDELPEIPAFVIFSKEIEEEREERQNIFIGCRRPQNYPKFGGFTYRDKLLKKGSLGVSKYSEGGSKNYINNSIYVTKSKKRDKILMYVLRKTFQNLGKVIAQQN